jgi:hypothetical protein
MQLVAMHRAVRVSLEEAWIYITNDDESQVVFTLAAGHAAAHVNYWPAHSTAFTHIRST